MTHYILSPNSVTKLAALATEQGCTVSELYTNTVKHVLDANQPITSLFKKEEDAGSYETVDSGSTEDTNSTEA